MKALFPYLALLAFVPILGVLIVAIIRWKYFTKGQFWLVALIIVALITQILTSVLWKLEMNNLVVLHFFTPIELFMLMAYYRSEFDNRYFKFMLLAVSLVFIGFAAVNMLFWQPLNEINTAVRSVECALLIIVSLCLWGKIMRDMRIENLAGTVVFWINTAVLFYFSGTALLYLFSNVLLQTAMKSALWLWTFHFALMLIYYILISIGLWKGSTKQALPPS